MRKKFLPFFKPSIGEEEINEVVDTLKSGWLTAGAKTVQFEEDFAKYIGAKYAVGVINCTAALELALIAAGVKQGDEVITTPMTFGATANVIEHLNAKVVFADVDRRTALIDPEEIKKKITEKTKALMPVHLYGQSCDMDAMMDIAKKHNLSIIEDAAHTIGAQYKGRAIGSSSDAACFSFYANKNITTGEGGMITTGSKEKADFFKMMRLHGLSLGAENRYKTKAPTHHHVVYPGYNFTMFDIQAAMGLWQLRKIKDFDAEREKIWERYDEAFRGMKGILLLETLKTTTRHGRHLYIIMADTGNLTITRDEFVLELRKRNIGTGFHYEALHLHPYYKKKYGFQNGDFPNALFISDRIISLPLYPSMEEKDIIDVIEAVNDICHKFRK